MSASPEVSVPPETVESILTWLQELGANWELASILVAVEYGDQNQGEPEKGLCRFALHPRSTLQILSKALSAGLYQASFEFEQRGLLYGADYEQLIEQWNRGHFEGTEVLRQTYCVERYFHALLFRRVPPGLRAIYFRSNSPTSYTLAVQSILGASSEQALEALQTWIDKETEMRLPSGCGPLLSMTPEDYYQLAQPNGFVCIWDAIQSNQ